MYVYYGSNVNNQQKNKIYFLYGKWPKISYTEVSNKMAYANSAEPDQAAPEGSTLFAIPLNILRENSIKSKNEFKILGHIM